jgi:hypothetical protein
MDEKDRVNSQIAKRRRRLGGAATVSSVIADMDQARLKRGSSTP